MQENRMEWKSKEGRRMKMKESRKDLRENERLAKDVQHNWESVKNKNNTVEQNLGTTSQENFLGVREI